MLFLFELQSSVKVSLGEGTDKAVSQVNCLGRPLFREVGEFLDYLIGVIHGLI